MVIKDKMKAQNILIGLLLREARLKNNMTQQQVAEKMNLTRESISQYEYGKRSINITDFFEMCYKCNFDADSIIDAVRNASEKELISLLKKSSKS